MSCVYYKFKSAKDYESVAFDGHFISVGELKAIIFEVKQLGRGRDHDLVITNAHTNEEYPKDEMLIPRNTSVLISRIPGVRCEPIVIAGAGVPKSMLMATPDGCVALPTGDVAVLKPNEKEIEGMPSSIGEVPPEFKCPLCKQVMKDCVFTSKCCFSSFCDKCIRDYTISRSMCVCGDRGVLADHLLPNKTLRDAINRILECNNSSSGNAFQAQDMPQSAASAPPPQRAKSAMELDKGRSLMKVKDDVLKEAASQRSAPLADEQKSTSVLPGAAEMQWRVPHENYMMPNSFNPYWNGFMPPYGGPMPPYMGYGVNPMDVGFGCILAYGGPVPPQTELAMGFNREEFGAHKGGLKRKRDGKYGGEWSVSSTCSTSGGSDHHNHQPERRSKKKSESHHEDKHYLKEQRSSSNKLTQPSESHLKRRPSEEEHPHSRSHSKRRCTLDAFLPCSNSMRTKYSLI